MEERLMLSEQIVNKRFNKKDEFYGLYVISCYGLLTKFENYQELIEEVFNTCEFYIGNKTIPKLLKKLGEDSPDYEETESNNLIGLSDNGIGYYMKKNKPVVYKDHNPKIYLTTMYGTTQLLDSTIHELSHIIKGRINSVYMNDESHIIQRCGLRLIENTEDNYEIFHNHMLDEVINVLQTSDMLKEIKEIDDNYLSSEAKEFYEKLDKNLLEETNGYEVGVMLLKPLWENNHFKDLVEDNIVEGSIDKIENEFNSIIGNNNAFSTFSFSLDIIFNDIDYNEYEILERGVYIDSIVKLYNLKSKDYKKYKNKRMSL